MNWLLKLNLIYETLSTGVRSSLLTSLLGKLSWLHLIGLITMVLLMWKWMGPFLSKNHLLRCWGWPSLLKQIGVLTLIGYLFFFCYLKAIKIDIWQMKWIILKKYFIFLCKYSNWIENAWMCKVMVPNHYIKYNTNTECHIVAYIYFLADTF